MPPRPPREPIVERRLVHGDDPRLNYCRGEVGGLKSEHSRRDVPLSAGMARRLWAIGADRPGTDRVFTSPLGMPLAYGNLRRRVLVPAARKAGPSWVTFHTFRHTCASLLFEAGRDVKQVASWLGHADPAFTLRTYVHLMDDGIGDADFLDAAVTADAARVNPGSTRRMETAANLAPAELTETADSGGNGERLQSPASPGHD